MNPNKMTQIALSKRVGWSEVNGRRWIKMFKQFIPVQYEGEHKYFNEESFKVLSIIKDMSENGFTSN